MGGVTEDMLKDGSAMTDRTLSPAAQAVLDAYRSIWLDEPLECDVECLAAALRSAADQVVPEPPKNWDLISTAAAREREIRKNLLAIAAELEGGND
jgi:hypothetical protein